MFIGKVSSAHLNPAVTLGFDVRGDFPWGTSSVFVAYSQSHMFKNAQWIANLFLSLQDGGDFLV